MTESLNEIVSNAQAGDGACAGCPAHADTAGQFVNPGLLNYDAEVMFLTMDPSHYIDWNSYADWAAYNAEKARQFKTDWPGGDAIQSILEAIPELTIDDIWLGDAIKCPVENERAGDVDTDEAFAHCSSYLDREIAEVDPTVIVTMGNNPAEQLLNGVFEMGVGTIKAGTRDCGTCYDTSPPVVVSPHWAHGWLNRHDNRAKVQNALCEVLGQ